MKNKIMYLIFIAAGVLLINATNGFSKTGFGENVNAACAPVTPFDGDCALCHTAKYSDFTPAKDAYKKGGTILTDYFCPDSPPPCTDNDSDGYGNPADSSCANSGLDCNDNNPAINPGAGENCIDGIDNNCNGLVDTQDPNALDCPLNCTDNDGDEYAIEGDECGAIDCNDTLGSVNPGAFEVCDDGIDNDCNNKTDCSDAACSGDPACLTEFCTDYNDRGSCKADPRCTWSGKEKACSAFPETQLECKLNGGRWSKKRGDCIYR